MPRQVYVIHPTQQSGSRERDVRCGLTRKYRGDADCQLDALPRRLDIQEDI